MVVVVVVVPLVVMVVAEVVAVVVVVVGPAQSNFMVTQQACVFSNVHVLIFAGWIIHGSGYESH